MAKHLAFTTDMKHTSRKTPETKQTPCGGDIL